MKRITILVLHLGVGGIEQAITNVANMLDEQRICKVTILSTYKLQSKPAFELSPNIDVEYILDVVPNREQLKDAIKSRNIIELFKQLRKSAKVIFEKYFKTIAAIKKIDTDYIMTTRDIHNKWVGKYAKSEIITIAGEHNHRLEDKRYTNKVIKSLSNIDYFLPVSTELVNFYSLKLKEKRNHHTKVLYMPNSIGNMPSCVSNCTSNVIISVGRLDKNKGMNELIEMFAKIIRDDKYDAWKLKIVGAGEELENLKLQCIKLGIVNRVEFKGSLNKEKLAKEYQSASIYVMMSHNESFGLVLVEAESFNLPVLAYASAGGPKQIIEDGTNGFLVPARDNLQMEKYLMTLMNNENLRKTMGNEGRKKATMYSNEVVKKMWKDFFENYINAEGVKNGK